MNGTLPRDDVTRINRFREKIQTWILYREIRNSLTLLQRLLQNERDYIIPLTLKFKLAS